MFVASLKAWSQGPPPPTAPSLQAALVEEATVLSTHAAPHALPVTMDG